jgi:ribonucleoside-diphosphate reductase alpha chain
MSAGVKHTTAAELDLSSNARIVLQKRYQRKNEKGEVVETPEAMFQRIAAAIAREEQKYSASPYSVQELENTFFQLMTSFQFLPNSPTLMNAGTDLGQLAACFVLSVGDSMEEIFDAVKHAALIHKSGGGTGFSFSRLRPKDSRVGSTGGVASGPISFIKIFNTATEQVKQGGTRRGANMGVLRVDHPDIMDFIRAKEREGQLNNFNLSVALTETFMQAVEKDDEYALIEPKSGQTAGTLRARDVFQLLVQKAWESGDPGIVFIDRMNADNPTPEQGAIESTNPCVCGETLVLTEQGPRKAKELTGQPCSLLINGLGYSSTETGFFSTGCRAVYTLHTREGFQLRLTRDHPLRRVVSRTRKTIRQEWVPAGELHPGDEIMLQDHRAWSGWSGEYGREEGYLLGLLIGDGTLKQDKAVLSYWVSGLEVNGKDDCLEAECGIMQEALQAAKKLTHRSDFQGWHLIPERNEYRLSLGSLKELAEVCGLRPGYKVVTERIEQQSSDFYRGFLRGIFDADASVQGSQVKGVSVRLTQSHYDNLLAIQRMLLRLGIVSRIYSFRRPEQLTSLPDGHGGIRTYRTRAQHELVISKDNLTRFAKEIGFADPVKQGKLETLLSAYKRTLNRERFVCTFEGLTYDGREEVFDVQVPGVNAFDANGLVVHNCGEQPLLPFEACNLGSINVSKFFAPGTEDGIDWEEFKESIHLSMRFLDNVIDASKYPLEQIQATVHHNRKVGLGIMGWADLLYQLEIPYNSRRGLHFAERLMDFFQQECWSASKLLAQERGPFPAYERSVYAQKNLGPYRNATTTTIAPTGTLSIIAGCSSGIEPLYALSFVRQVMDGENLLEVNSIFEQALKKAQCHSQGLMQEVAQVGSIQAMEHLPESIRRVFVTAMDIDPEFHLKMQAAFQKYTDNAVSKTVNLPHSALQEDIYRIYWNAYEFGCKGVTVYRDGSKSEQVLSSGRTQESLAQGKAAVKTKERPEVVYGFTQKVKTGLGDLYLTVNEVDGQPFEVFATIGRSGRSITAKSEAIGRLVSLVLRSGINVREVVHQLKGIGGEHPVFQKKGLLLSIPDAVAWVLENRYLSENKPTPDPGSLSRPNCPECGEVLYFQEGCFLCQACGYTKCG